MQFAAGRRVQLLKHKTFASYLLVCFLSTFGSGLCYIISNWLILKVNNHVISLLVMMVCFWFPNVLLGPFWGVIVDRYSRKNLLIWSNAARAAILLGFSWYFHYHSLSVYSLDVLMLLLGSLFGVIWPASIAMIREVVASRDLLYANSLVDIVYEIGNVVGMGSAGFLLAAVSPSLAYGITGCMFVAAAFAMLGVNIKYQTRQIKNEKTAISKDFVLGLQYLKSNKKLVLIYYIQLTILASFMIAPILLAPFAKNVLHATEIEFGIIEAALSVGVILGGLALPWIAEKAGFIRAILSLTISLAIFYILFAINQHVRVAILLYLIIGFVLSAWPLIVTKAQEITVFHYQGRVQSVFSSISSMIVVFTYICIAIGSPFISIKWLYLFPTVLALFSVFLVLRLRRMELKAPTDKISGHIH